jgi:hypothetical protein
MTSNHFSATRIVAAEWHALVAKQAVTDKNAQKAAKHATPKAGKKLKGDKHHSIS